MIDRRFDSDLYVHGNVSFFEMSANTDFIRYDFGMTANLILTKQWDRLAWSITGHYRGGANDEFLLRNASVTEPLADYYRIDTQLKYKWRESNELVLDIQNLTSRENDAYYFFDSFLQEVVLEKQLGIIPILSYKRFLN